jgi:C4-dicarboxylate transporter DctM subunit
MNIFLLIVGCVMDSTPAILILAPILQPIAALYGFDIIHFGLILVLNLVIGFCTPPVGLNLYVAAGLRKTTIENVVGNDLIMYILFALAVLVLLIIFPGIIMLLPDMMVK